MSQRGIAQIAAAGALTLGVMTLAGLPVASKHVEEQQYVAIRWLDVDGDFERVSADQIQSAAAPYLVDGFFALEVTQLQAAIEGLPWIREAIVRKRWPDQVHLTVFEHQPLARWGSDELVSDRGNIFSVRSPSDIAGLPRLNGPADSAEQVVTFYVDLQNRLVASGLNIDALEMTPRGAWTATLTDGLQLIIGSERPLQRFDRFVASLDQLGVVPGNVPERVDLRYPNGFSVTWPDPIFTPEPDVEVPAQLEEVPHGEG